MIKLYPFHLVSDEIAKNAEDHYQQVIEDITTRPQIDWEYFLNLSQTGQCVATVLIIDNEFRGYSVYTIGSDPLFKNKIEAHGTAFYIQPDYRKYARNFFKESHKLLEEYGVVNINYMLNNPRLGKFMERIGFKPKYTIWSTENGQNS